MWDYTKIELTKGYRANNLMLLTEWADTYHPSR